MKNNKTQRGITLIALVITIVLLLILAGITISSLGGENGLFAKTKQAKVEQMKAEAKENITLAIMQIQIDDAEEGKETTLHTLHDKLPDTDARIAVNDYNEGETELTGIYDAGEKKFNYTIDEFFNVTIGDEVEEKPETVTFGPITWNGGKAEVTISTKTADTIQYQINGTEEGSWTTGTTVTGLNHNDKLYARLINGTITTEPEELEIKDIIKPEEFTITVSNATPTRVTVTGSTVDNETGIKDYTYVAVPTEGNTVEFKNITDTTYEITGLEPNTEYTIYMIAYDNAGNERKSNGIKQITQSLEMEITEPYIGTSTTTTNSASSVADNSQSRGKTLYINFSATLSGTQCTIVNKDDNQAIPYAITQNGIYTFVVTGTYDGKVVTDEIEVVVNKYGTATDVVQYDAGTWTQAEIDALSSSKLYDYNESRSAGDGTYKLNDNNGLNFTFGGFKAGDSRNNSVNPQEGAGTPKYGGWQILSKETKTDESGNIIKNVDGTDRMYVTKLVHAGSPENFVYYYTKINDSYRAEYLLSNGERQTGYSTLSNGTVINPRSWEMYKDKELEAKGFIKEVHAMTYDEAYAITGDIASTDGIRKTGSYYWLESAYNYDIMWFVYINGRMNANDIRCCWGVRPVVELNDGVYIASGTGTEEDPYILGMIETTDDEKIPSDDSYDPFG